MWVEKLSEVKLCLKKTLPFGPIFTLYEAGTTPAYDENEEEGVDGYAKCTRFFFWIRWIHPHLCLFFFPVITINHHALLEKIYVVKKIKERLLGTYSSTGWTSFAWTIHGSAALWTRGVIFGMHLPGSLSRSLVSRDCKYQRWKINAEDGMAAGWLDRPRAVWYKMGSLMDCKNLTAADI